MKWHVRLLDGARREMRCAAANYEGEREGLGDRFLDEIAAVRNQIAELPERLRNGCCSSRKQNRRVSLRGDFVSWWSLGGSNP
jgi:hypothetical protein